MKTNTSNNDEHSPCEVDENCKVRRGWYCENCILNKGIMQSYAKAISDVEKIIPCDYAIAKRWHDLYEQWAIELGWNTQRECKKEFEDLPKKNKQVMLIVARLFREELKQEIARLHHSQPVSEETKFATSKKVAPSTGNSFIHESADIVDCSQQSVTIKETSINPCSADANDASYSEYHRNDAEGEGK